MERIDINEELIYEEVKKDIFHKDTLHIEEKYLSYLPESWRECLVFLLFNIDGHLDYFTRIRILDEEKGYKLLKFLKRDFIKVIIFKNEKNSKYCWSVDMIKINNNIMNNDTVLLIGGERLRRYCDERNIYYKSIMTKEGDLAFASSLKLLKNEGEDCRVPLMGDIESMGLLNK